MKFIIGNLPSVLLMSLILLANAQRSSNNLKDVDIQELARQNKITKQILEAFIQKKLGVTKDIRPPSIQEILPVMRHQEERVPRGSDQEQLQENQEFAEDDSLQSVESEQIASIYSEGRKKYISPPFEGEVDPNSCKQIMIIINHLKSSSSAYLFKTSSFLAFLHNFCSESCLDSLT